MNIKKLLLGVSALSGLIGAHTAMAVPVGGNAMISTAKIVCTASLSGDVPLSTVTGAGQQQGIESSWLINNLSETDSLAITQIDSYDINGKLLVSLTPASNPELPTETNGFFTWSVLPHQVARFPHDYSMIYPDAATGAAGTEPKLVRWYNVVFTLANATLPGAEIAAPSVSAAMVERGPYTVQPTPTVSGQAPVISRTRNECTYMM